MNKLSIVLVSLLFSACASTPPSQTETAAPSEKEKATLTSPATAQTGTETIGADQEANKLNDEIQNLLKLSVYFEYDKFTLNQESRETLEKQAAFIKSHNNDVVTLQGNTDERGSSEYNLALGAKRANAVKASLKIMGISDSQIKEASFGEEKPKMTCHEEACWKENRRVDFLHTLN